MDHLSTGNTPDWTRDSLSRPSYVFLALAHVLSRRAGCTLNTLYTLRDQHDPNGLSKSDDDLTHTNGDGLE
ncbi:hypothetical protein Taro_053504 [Colocasia esculenta]|uniref:Uncharacterized protein n=1 Tax=Colocasia esculenta TaxID=4460 RepID=A0A843XMS4_COLES|nr:hypothetical protein [Colocasia esculenta]